MKCPVGIWYVSRYVILRIVHDKMVGISLRHRDQIKSDVWGVLGKVIHSNGRFGLTDRLNKIIWECRLVTIQELKRWRGIINRTECYQEEYSRCKERLLVFASCTYYCYGPSEWWPKVQIIEEWIFNKAACWSTLKVFRYWFRQWWRPWGTSTGSESCLEL
jgi:hypothetical protein